MNTSGVADRVVSDHKVMQHGDKLNELNHLSPIDSICWMTYLTVNGVLTVLIEPSIAVQTRALEKCELGPINE
jgi:hypothetical protein